MAIHITDVNRRCAVLLHLVGDDIAETFETLPEPNIPGEDAFETCKHKLTAYLAPCRNVIAERMVFHGMKMEDREDFEHFLGRLRVQLRRCGYTAAENERELRDRCVAGCSAELRPKMLQKAAARGDALTLELCVGSHALSRTRGSWGSSWTAAERLRQSPGTRTALARSAMDLR